MACPEIELNFVIALMTGFEKQIESPKRILRIRKIVADFCTFRHVLF